MQESRKNASLTFLLSCLPDRCCLAKEKDRPGMSELDRGQNAIGGSGWLTRLGQPRTASDKIWSDPWDNLGQLRPTSDVPQAHVASGKELLGTRPDNSVNCGQLGISDNFFQLAYLCPPDKYTNIHYAHSTFYPSACPQLLLLTGGRG